MSILRSFQAEYQTQSPILLALPVRNLIDEEVAHLLHILASNATWHERKVAAQKLADLGGEEARIGLLEALLNDPFWMVRCAIIQSLERIGEEGSVPVLQIAVESDPNEIVRQYAAVAVERLAIAG